MEALLSDLPGELLEYITRFISLEDMKALSSLNTRFRQFLEPALFRGLRATNRKTDASLIEDMVTKLGRHVETLRFYCYLRPNQGWWVDRTREADRFVDNGIDNPLYTVVESSDLTNGEESNVASVAANTKPKKTTVRLTNDWDQPGFSDIAKDLLQGKCLPRLRRVGITFEPLNGFNTVGVWATEGFNGEGTSIYIHEQLETSDETCTEEEIYSWRADLNLVFQCLCHNASINDVEIHNFLLKPTSTFYELEWSALLARLSGFDLHLWGGDNGAGWASSTQSGYLESISCLHELMFQHLKSAKKVSFAADACCVVGCEGMRQTPVPMRADTLPSLRELTLRNFYIDEALSIFLKAKAQQIRTLRLLDCYSGRLSHDPDDNNPTWATLLRDFSNSQPVLQALELSNDDIGLRCYFRGHAIQQAFTEVGKSGGQRKLFMYAYQSDKYGSLNIERDVTLNQYRAGQDQEAYDALMDLVQQNRSGDVSSSV